MKIDEAGVVQTDGSENLLRVALPARGNLRLTSAPGPGRMQGGSLPKRSLIFENHHRPFDLGVFLDSGTCSAPTCGVALHRPEQAGWWAGAPGSLTAAAICVRVRHDTVAPIPLRCLGAPADWSRSQFPNRKPPARYPKCRTVPPVPPGGEQSGARCD